MSETHAILSPSSAERWLTCVGSVAMEQPYPDSTSSHAAEGTKAHTLLELALKVFINKANQDDIAAYAAFAKDCDTEMLENIDWVFQQIQERVAMHETAGAHTVELYSERRVRVGQFTSEEGAEGTLDVSIVAHYDDRVVCDIGDLKYGRGVEVSPVENPQLKLYAGGMRDELALVTDISDFNLLIWQPRIDRTTKEWAIGAVGLDAWLKSVWPKGESALGCLSLVNKSEYGGPKQLMLDNQLVPSEKGCKFCRASGRCPALAQYAADSVGIQFDNLNEIESPAKFDNAELGLRMAAIPLIEIFIKAVRGCVEQELLANREVPGFKLVEGRKGARAWTSEEEAETVLKSFRFKKEQMYNYKLISPTQAETLLKGEPKRWAKVQPIIQRADGKPSVAPELDPRPAITVLAQASDFDDVSGE